ncbi:MAG: 6-bladed beta-propeller [Dysgonamonadaceae bacterium]
MKNYKITAPALIFFIILLTGCSKSKDVTPEMIKIGKELQSASMLDFIEGTNTIQLATNDSGLIGVVSKMQVVGERIYIMDSYIAKSIFVFDMHGKLINRFGKIGGGPGEYLLITDFFVDKANKRIRLLANGNKIIDTDLDGNYVKEQILNYPHLSFLFPVGNNLFLGNHVTAGDEYLLYVVNPNYKETGRYLPLPSGYEKVAISTFVGYTGIDDKYLFAPVASPIIYGINRNGCLPKYEFDFDNSLKLTHDKIKNLEKENNIMSVIEKTKDLFCLTSYFETNENLFVTYSLKEEDYWGIYDREERQFKCVNTKKITNLLGIDTPKVYFLSQVDNNTIAGIYNNEEKELNPMVLICRLKH